MNATDDCRVVTPAGDIDLATLDDFRALLQDADEGVATCVVLDLSAIEFVDSMGRGAPLEADGRLAPGEALDAARRLAPSRT